MAVVGRPPVLGLGHKFEDVFFYRIQVEAPELLCIVKALAHRIGQGRMLTQYVQLQQIWPPVLVASATSTGKWALAFTFANVC